MSQTDHEGRGREIPPLQVVRSELIYAHTHTHTHTHTHARHNPGSHVHAGSVQGDDISAMMDEICKAHFYLQTARSVVEEYRQFCRKVRKVSAQ